MSFLDQPHITQFSATAPWGDFNCYVRPRKNISNNAYNLTGIWFDSYYGQMFVHGEPVNSVSMSRCLKDFMRYIGDQDVTVVAHNAHAFDAPILVRAAAWCNLLDDLREQVVAVCDTLPIVREVFPEFTGLHRPYSLESLVNNVLYEDYTGHDGLDNAYFLRRVYDKTRPSSDLENYYTRPIEHYYDTI